MGEKLLAEWFWLDRWAGSSAVLLPLEARGLYREMLSEAWRRGAKLPTSHDAIQRAVRCTSEEWARAWPLVERYWRHEGDWLVNETQQEIYAEAKRRSDLATARGRAGAQALLKQRLSTTRAEPEHQPPSPSPSPSPSPISGTGRKSVPSAAVRRALNAEPNAEMAKVIHARSHRPVFTGQRVVVHEWMLDELDRLLGPHFLDFDVHEWFFALDAECVKQGWIPPARDNAAWLKQQAVLEAQKRGLPLTVVEASANGGKPDYATLAKRGPSKRPSA